MRVYSGVRIPLWIATDQDLYTVRQMIMVSKTMEVIKIIQVFRYPGQMLHPVNGGKLVRMRAFEYEYDKMMM